MNIGNKIVRNVQITQLSSLVELVVIVGGIKCNGLISFSFEGAECVGKTTSQSGFKYSSLEREEKRAG